MGENEGESASVAETTTPTSSDVTVSESDQPPSTNANDKDFVPKERWKSSPGKGDSCRTVFENIHYLGCSKIDDPSSEAEMLKLMRFLDEQRTSASVTVSLSVPHFAGGIVVLHDSSGGELTSFPVQRIRFCVRGRLDSAQSHCFSISFTHQGANGEQTHQCHVFRCSQSDTAGRALYCFSQAFSNSSPVNAEGNGKRLEYKFEACLEIRVSGLPLTVTKCFGMLLAAGRNLRHSDMQLLELETMGPGAVPSTYLINAIWDPRIHIFDVLNTETPRESRVFLTVAADVIIAEAGEPIRFRIEAKARVFHRDERFYKLPRVSVREGYSLTLEVWFLVISSLRLLYMLLICGRTFFSV
ncbi:unnamed protein product [Heligmosomoides polygyrus]|uniref:PID domain-containing protein n=1 Tax=Heligmosomoides polygyrus TaxID=6339 RepID=A0A3P8CBW7_HELPZ|nr:unnamed protein product [Heligmosomoides polygyrus]